MLVRFGHALQAAEHLPEIVVRLAPVKFVADLFVQLDGELQFFHRLVPLAEFVVHGANAHERSRAPFRVADLVEQGRAEFIILQRLREFVQPLIGVADVVEGTGHPFLVTQFLIDA